ncbi:MAG: mannitol dehydrogenase family protein [Propioniciclava sp.]
MFPLANDTLADLPPALERPRYDRSQVGVGIAHFGVGNFHRVHQAVYVDRCLHLPGHQQWGIVGIGISDGPQARTKAEAYRRQDGLFTVTEMSPDGARQARVIGAMVDYLLAPANPEAVLHQLSDPNLRIVSLTISEGGYPIAADSGDFVDSDPAIAADIGQTAPPTTVFGFIVRALARRRADGLPGFTIVSCDNLRGNGATTRKAVCGFARHVDPGLAEWIADQVTFPNSMVDRIAPYVSAADSDQLNAATGVDDELPAIGERHLQWVLQDEFVQGRPALDQVGVQFRTDVGVFEAVKGRMLNATHVLMSYPALLLGHRMVHEAMADPDIRHLLETFLARDVVPRLTGPHGVDLHAYGEEILDRFANPAVGDQLIRIATDGSAKIPVFHAATLADLLAAGADIKREAFLLACYQRYLVEARDDQGDALEVTEPSLRTEDRESIPGPDGLGVLRLEALAALGLDQHQGFVSSFRQMVAGVRSRGTRATLAYAVQR